MISSQQAGQALQQQLTEIKDRLMVAILEAIEAAFTFQAPPSSNLTWAWEATPVSSFDEFLASRVVPKENPTQSRTVKDHMATLQPPQLEELLRSTDLFLMPVADSVNSDFYSAVALGQKQLLMHKASKPLKVKDTLRALALSELKDKARRPELQSYLPEALMMKQVDLDYCLAVMNTVLGFTFYNFPQLQQRSKALAKVEVPVLPKLQGSVSCPEANSLATTKLLMSQLVDLGNRAVYRGRLEASLAKEEESRAQFIRRSETTDYNTTAFSEMIEIT
jgi:hypothetical protein